MDLITSLFTGADSIPGRDNDDIPGSTSPKPRSPPKKSPPKPADFPIKLFLFTTLLILTALAIITTATPLYILLNLRVIPHSTYRGVTRSIERCVGSFMVILAYLFCPGTEVVVSGDWELMKDWRKTIVFANHQIYPDWFYLWVFAWTRNCHADLRIMMIKVLSQIPLIGPCLTLLDFIFLHQNLTLDKPILTSTLTQSRQSPHPLWLLIFPEGGLNWTGGIAKSRAYAEKAGVDWHPTYCILPKSTGLFYSIESLQSVDVFDLTVAYSGVEAGDVPYDVLPPNKVFLEGLYPREVHVHVNRYRVREQVPGFRNVSGDGDETKEEESVRRGVFDLWLRDTVWKEKDLRLTEFYEGGDLRLDWEKEKTRRIAVVPCAEDYLYFGGLMFALWVLLPVYTDLIYWTLMLGVRFVTLALAVLMGMFGLSRLSLWVAFMAFLGQTSGTLGEVGW